MLTLINGLIFIILGLVALYKNIDYKLTYRKIKNSKDYEKTIGTVICNAYSTTNINQINNRPTTPIVEFEVNGIKYETINRTLINGNQLPEGTKVYLWYKKDNPNEALLATDCSNNSLVLTLIGVGCIFAGLLFIL